MPQAEQVQLSVLITHRTGRGSKARISQVGKNLVKKGLWFELKEQKTENAWQAERRESTQEVFFGGTENTMQEARKEVRT